MKKENVIPVVVGLLFMVVMISIMCLIPDQIVKFKPKNAVRIDARTTDAKIIWLLPNGHICGQVSKHYWDNTWSDGGHEADDSKWYARVLNQADDVEVFDNAADAVKYVQNFCKDE